MRQNIKIARYANLNLGELNKLTLYDYFTMLDNSIRDTKK